MADITSPILLDQTGQALVKVLGLVASQASLNYNLDEIYNIIQSVQEGDPVRLSGRVRNVVSATTTAAVEWNAQNGNGDTYRVVASAESTALKGIVGLSVKCPEFSAAAGQLEQVMAVEFIPTTADFSLTLTTQGGDTVTTIPWVDGVAPTWQANKVYTLIISRQGVSVSYRSTSNLYGE